MQLSGGYDSFAKKSRGKLKPTLDASKGKAVDKGLDARWVLGFVD